MFKNGKNGKIAFSIANPKYTYFDWPDNNNTGLEDDPFMPEVWAQESLMILEANMVMANLVHRDFSNELARFGQVVHTRQPSSFTARRKTSNDDVYVQAATGTDVAVRMDQHVHTSFMIRDGEETKSFKNLVQEFLTPAVVSIAQFVDQICIYQLYENIRTNVVGKIGTALSKATILDAKAVMDANKVPLYGRNLVLTSSGYNDLLAIAEFTTADKIGDDGTVMREGSLGRRFGFQMHMTQNAPSIAYNASQDTTTTIAETDGHAIGATSITVASASGFVAGEWLVVAGDMTPQLITNVAGTTITISPGLKTAVVFGATVYEMNGGTVAETDGYAQYYTKEITTSGFNSIDPAAGQMLSQGTSASANKCYGAMAGSEDTSILLNRSLDTALSFGNVIGLGPWGEYNYAFHRNAVALVSRPLAAPTARNVAAYTASYNGLGLRVTITYDGRAQGHLVTLDLLCGVKTLDPDLGCVILAG